VIAINKIKIKLLPSGKKKSHRFLTIMMSLSLMVHLMLFWSFSSVQMFKTHIVPDLTFENTAEPPSRIIPRPRSTARELSDLDDIKDIQNFKVSAGAPPPSVETTRPTSGQPFGGASFAGASAGISAGNEGTINVPSIPGVAAAGNPGMHISQWNPALSEFGSPKDYYHMVQMKIEAYKQYPATARKQNQEDRVTVCFIIGPDGAISDLKILKGSRFKTLDQAALDAVKNCAPFPRPPPVFFDGPLKLQLTLLFELT